MDKAMLKFVGAALAETSALPCPYRCSCSTRYGQGNAEVCGGGACSAAVRSTELGAGSEEDSGRGGQGSGQPVLHRARRWLCAVEQGKSEVGVHVSLHRPRFERRRERRGADRR